ncbi:protein of unknown function (plasmid) [Cupriavidus taiwanensis]|uniref:Uncharacterized protein n=1 Tax=Cupriavidus taiwanensis TaxID=164546 RepID=A0A375IRK5_9BURK|nr:protein of unknown function [Cupriavidus taiwanensis]
MERLFNNSSVLFLNDQSTMLRLNAVVSGGQMLVSQSAYQRDRLAAATPRRKAAARAAMPDDANAEARGNPR